MKGFQSGAEVIETSFHLWNENRRAMNRADWNPAMIISKECFKGIVGSISYDQW